MEKLKQLNVFTKTALIAGLLCVIYGYLCRIAGLFFFWESKSIGWMLLCIGIISLLVNRIKTKKDEKDRSIPEKIVIGIICFVLLIQTLIMAIIPSTDAYAAAKQFLYMDKDLKAEVGTIIGFGLIQRGGVHKKSDASGVSGDAAFKLTIKGEQKFKDVTIFVVKYADSPDWMVDGIE